MARYLEAKCRLCRREGEKLFLKGERCYSDKCAIEKRNTPPGQSRPRRGRLSDYGAQLREKQKTKRIYGLNERQFHNAYAEADRRKGVTGEILLQLLACRLDNIVHRLGFASSKTEARQLIRHNGILVNGQRVNIPSYRVTSGSVIELSDKAQKQLRTDAAMKAATERGLPTWLELDAEHGRGVLKALPQRDELSQNIREQLIIELYSK
jgi:small subunit ribosomal protein S4